jgi:hypothetical protein
MWTNRLLHLKKTWFDKLVEENILSEDMLFLAVLGAQKIDKETFRNEPVMLHYLVKEIPNLIKYESDGERKKKKRRTR